MNVAHHLTPDGFSLGHKISIPAVNKEKYLLKKSRKREDQEQKTFRKKRMGKSITLVYTREWERKERGRKKREERQGTVYYVPIPINTICVVDLSTDWVGDLGITPICEWR